MYINFSLQWLTRFFNTRMRIFCTEIETNVGWTVLYFSPLEQNSWWFPVWYNADLCWFKQLRRTSLKKVLTKQAANALVPCIRQRVTSSSAEENIANNRLFCARQSFNDGLSRGTCIASKCVMIIEQWIGSDLEGTSRAEIQCPFQAIFWRNWRETPKAEDNRLPGHDLNTEIPKKWLKGYTLECGIRSFVVDFIDKFWRLFGKVFVVTRLTASDH